VYKILAFIGEAGVGKDSIANAVLAADPSLHKIVSCTTRLPREKEQNGVDYHFLTAPEFRLGLINKKFAESAIFNGWYYGTRFEDLSKVQLNIGVFNPAGIRNLLKLKDIDLRVIRIQASEEERKRRYIERDAAADLNELERRIKTDTHDFSLLDFEYVTLKNENKDDFEKAVETISKWIGAWKAIAGQK
jgi:guanylate kinase